MRIAPPPLFAGPLMALEPNAAAIREGELLQQAIDGSRDMDSLEVAGLLEAFLEEYPGSAWEPGLRVCLGKYWFGEGAYSNALQHWATAWELTKDYSSGPGKQVADHALAQWTRLLVGLGRLDELSVIFEEVGERHLDAGPLEQTFLRTRELWGVLQWMPAASYRGGWKVADLVVRKARGRGLDPSRADAIYQESNLFEGCSLRVMAELTKTGGYQMKGVARPAGAKELLVPSVMHLRQNHYVALLEVEHGLIRAFDPMWGERHFRPEVLDAEASGHFLVPADTQLPGGWRRLSAEEMRTTLGRCLGGPGWFGAFLDMVENLFCGGNCGGGPGGGGGGPGPGNHGGPADGAAPAPGGDLNAGCGGDVCLDKNVEAGGMVRWQVTEPNINLWLIDEPIRCQPAYGSAVGLKLYYKQRDEIAPRPRTFNFGEGGNSNWLSWIDNYDYARYGVLMNTWVTVFLPGGGSLDFYFEGAATVSSDYYYNARLVALFNGGNLTGYRLELPDGRQFIYAYEWETDYLYLTEALDAQGFGTHYNYVETLDPWYYNVLRLQSVTDHVGQTLYIFQYNESYYFNSSLVSVVTDRFGRSVQLSYADSGNYTAQLTQIQDAANLTSAITYTAEGWPDTLTTPYGATSFAYEGFQSDSGARRRVDITEPSGEKQIYLFGADWWCKNLPTAVPSYLVPDNLPAGALLDTISDRMNSYYWNREQSIGVPVLFDQITTNHLNTARLRHWLYQSDSEYSVGPDLALSYEQMPSTDSGGSSWGQITWRDYAGKGSWAPWARGTQIEPSLIARKLPDGSTWYQSFARNALGRPTSRTETYGTGNPASTRTFAFTYAANGIDVTEVYRPGSELVTGYTYNSRHQVLTQSLHPEAQATYTTIYTYDGYGRLTQVQHPTGLTATYAYTASSDGYAGYLSSITEQPIARSQSFTWDDGNLRTLTDARGLTRTFTRDGLNRLTRIDYPAHGSLPATYVQYSYDLQPGMGFNTTGSAIPILHRTGIRDRLGKWTWYGRDRVARVVAVKDPLNHETTYTYCGCGGPETITDARNKTTSLYYNNAGWKTQVVYADNTSETYGYNALGQLTSRTDTLGSRTYSYTNQGLLLEIDNAFGAERAIGYDVHDHAVSLTDAQGVTTTQTFDRLGRLLTRAVPGQGAEQFVYSARGLTDYTGPDGKLTQYAYDEAGRKTSETTPKNETISYAYNAAGDLLTLTDGRNKTTTWTYDLEGQVKTKQYHGQTFANLEYDHDANGRLAWRKFWSSPNSAKQTVYTHDDAGNLTLINYPASPDISFAYNAVNQIETMSDAVGTTTYTYTDAGNLQTEDGPWSNDTLTYSYHTGVPKLRTGLAIAQPAGSWSQTYAHDAARRLQTLTSPAGPFTYTYLGAANVWTNLALPNSAAITNAYNTAGRLSGTWLRNSSGAILNQHLYAYNAAGQRSEQTRTDASLVTYGYDDDAQLASAVGSGGQSTENLAYGYDAGWNLTQRTSGGAPTNYSVNDRNQVTNDGVNSYSYNANGNRTTKYWYGTSPGSIYYSYDDENQLISIATDTYYTPPYYRWKSTFTYDGRGRLRVRKDYTWDTYYYGYWSLSSERRYVYDGMLLLQERTAGATPTVTYTRGTDLSGSLEGAGGIGGLLARSYGYSGATGDWSTHHYYHADGGGNVTCLISASQMVAASYRYDPFGRTLSQSGSLANANLFRFSSKLIHPNSGLYYYGYRFYDPDTQRWMNRDPIDEKGHMLTRSFQTHFKGSRNTYRFVGNRPLDRFDAEGLILQGCAIGGVIGTVSGFIGGLGVAVGTGCWKPAACGALGGAIGGCIAGTIASTGAYTVGGCIGGAVQSAVTSLCLGGDNYKNPCSLFAALASTLGGCVGGWGGSPGGMAKWVAFLMGMDISAITTLCSE